MTTKQRGVRFDPEATKVLDALPPGLGNALLNRLVREYRDNIPLQEKIAQEDPRFAPGYVPPKHTPKKRRQVIINTDEERERPLHEIERYDPVPDTKTMNESHMPVEVPVAEIDVLDYIEAPTPEPEPQPLVEPIVSLPPKEPEKPKKSALDELFGL